MKAVDYQDVLMMPATRAEIYVRNDGEIHTEAQYYILKSKRHEVGTDIWPEIQLARIKLEPNAAASKVLLALNAPVAIGPSPSINSAAAVQKPQMPVGCIRASGPDVS